MSRIVFMLEERSMEVLLEGIMPRFFPGTDFICIRHEGKQDLEKSLPRKLRAWKQPGARFVVVRDNDNGDCAALKQKLRSLCEEGRRPDALIRIPCQELEAWYFGEPNALSRAYGDAGLATLGVQESYRDPDAIAKPSARLRELIPMFQKISGARLMSQQLSREENSSVSYRVFIEGLDREIKLLPTN